MSDAISGHITAFFLFDVAEGLDLGRVQRELGAGKGSVQELVLLLAGSPRV